MGASRSSAMSIFGRVLEIDSPSEREAYLNRECGDDVSLRREVDGLLQAFLHAGSSIKKEERSPRTEQNEPPAEAPGTMIGNNKLLERIGEGGMGVVYMAEQVEPVRRRVAIKVIKAGMDSSEVIARFEAERQALALMDHPNIAKVLDAGTISEVRSQKSERTTRL
jgi:serine/threonine protein kinase